MTGKRTYAWEIDVDHEATVFQRCSIGNMGGRGGPAGTIGLPIPKPHSFRIVNGEGKVMLEGRTNAATIDPHAPLRDIGRKGFIEYLKGDQWVRPPDEKQ